MHGQPALNLLLNGHRDAGKQGGKPLQLGEQVAQHVANAQHLATPGLHVQLLVIIKVRFIPINKVCRRLCEPDVHEPKGPNVRRVTVVHQAKQLFAGQLQCEELVQDAKGSGHDATGSNSTHPSAHAGLARCLAASFLPWLQVLNIVINFVNNFMICLQLVEIYFEIGRRQYVREDQVVEVHRFLVAP